MDGGFLMVWETAKESVLFVKDMHYIHIGTDMTNILLLTAPIAAQR
jgi:hypothetical protein